MNRRNRRQIVRWIRLGVLALLFIMLICWLMPEANLDQETWSAFDTINRNYNDKIRGYDPNNEEYVKIRVDAKVDSIVETIKKAVNRNVKIAGEYKEDVQAEVKDENEKGDKERELKTKKEKLRDDLERAKEEAHKAFADFEKEEKAEWRRILAWVLRADRKETGDKELDIKREQVNKGKASKELKKEYESADFMKYVKEKEQDSEFVKSNMDTGNPEGTVEAVKNLIEKYDICLATSGHIKNLINSGDKRYKDNSQWKGMKYQLSSKELRLRITTHARRQRHFPHHVPCQGVSARHRLGGDQETGPQRRGGDGVRRECQRRRYFHSKCLLCCAGSGSQIAPWPAGGLPAALSGYQHR